MRLREAPLDQLDRRDQRAALARPDNQKQVDKVLLVVVQLVLQQRFNPKQLLSSQLCHQIVKYLLALDHALI